MFALAKPRHLGKALTASPLKQPEHDIVVREQAMMARVALDLSDAMLLTGEATHAAGGAKVLGATLTWAGLNVAAIVADRKG